MRSLRQIRKIPLPNWTSIKFPICDQGGGGGARRAKYLASAAGGDIFPYQMALAEFDFAQGKVCR